MKKAKWITAEGFAERKDKFAWETKVEGFNRRDWDIDRGPGLLTCRKTFCVKPGLRRAILRITSLGIWEAYLNGGKITGADGERDELMPLCTDYRHRVMEGEYAVTRQLHVGDDNRIVARVSSGWWSGRISFGYNGYRPTALAAELELEYEGGICEIIASGEDWESAIVGPVMTADIWDGEYFDARIPDPATDPMAQSEVFVKASLMQGEAPEIVPFLGEPVRVLEYREPRTAVVYRDIIGASDGDFGEIMPLVRRFGDNCEALQLKAGEHVILDFGEDLVGRPTVAMRAEDGTNLRVAFAEMKNESGDPKRGNDGPRGSLYTQNYRTARSRLHYVAWSKGGRELNIYRPLHTFFGYRYLELTADRDIELVCVTTEVLGSTVEEVGRFTSSNAEVNRLFSNICRGMRGNYLSIPTDCPQRDERLGWTGDTQIFCMAGTYLADTYEFFRKWLADCRDSQIGHDGEYPSVIPRTAVARDYAAAWSDAGIIVAYRMWQMYGDIDILAEHYDSMEAYMARLERDGTDGPHPIFGDWLSYEGTDSRYISVCYLAYDARLMADISRLLGKREREAHYCELFASVCARFRRDYLTDDRVNIKSQTGYLLPIAFGILEGEERELASSDLVSAIADAGYTLKTGFVGTGLLTQTLSAIGRDDIAYALLTATTDPSWLYSVRQGATTVWERWNSYTHEKGFGNVEMNSFNHYAYGAVAEWLFAGVAGIRPDPIHGGFDRPTIAPRPMRADWHIEREGNPSDDLTMAEACYRGISSRWEYEGGKFVLTVTIPDGEADIEFPRFNSETKLILNDLVVSPEELGGKTEASAFLFSLPAGKYRMVSCN